MGRYGWNQVDLIELDDREQWQLQEIVAHLVDRDTQLMNEATIWARAIYPLLLLAEQQQIEAWAAVPLRAKYKQFVLEGVADGALGHTIAGRFEAPYLIVVEAKKGIDHTNPIGQLYGQLLAATHLNWQRTHTEPQEMFGCYTIADTWKFMRAEIAEIESDRPIMKLEYSREYVEKLEAATIFKILKGIVSRYLYVSKQV